MPKEQQHMNMVFANPLIPGSAVLRGPWLSWCVPKKKIKDVQLHPMDVYRGQKGGPYRPYLSLSPANSHSFLLYNGAS
jgi:hypothetical protein